MTSFRYVPPPEESHSNAPPQRSGFKSGALIAAFQILDTKRQGYFPKDILLHILTRKGERGLDPDFVQGVLDKVSIGGRVYYRDLCELFRETAMKAEAQLDIVRDSEETQRVETVQEVPNETVEMVEPAYPMDSKPKVTPGNSFSDSDDSYPNFDHTPVPTPERPGSASTGQVETLSLPLTAQDNESMLDQASSLQNVASVEHLEEVSPNSEDADLNGLHGGAAMQGVGEIPELLKQAESDQN